MSNDYHYNHYVPRWYQKQFILPENNGKLYYLKLKPAEFKDSRGQVYTEPSVRLKSPKSCFAERDLYTANFGNVEQTWIEKAFFGTIDKRGRKAVQFFSNFIYKDCREGFINDLILYMCTQKLRTPKGLAWLAKQTKNTQRDEVLKNMLYLRQIFSAIWIECVWLIADASKSKTKFIVSDHPITLYNRRLGPNSDLCKGSNDPDIRLHGTHTVFPLSTDKVLILTNLSWVRNPYQSPVKPRPHPFYFRGALMNFLDIQTERHLQEAEVRQINFIIKKRAYRYIAASNEEWLYPEKYVSISDWNLYGDGYLLMPDPRSVELRGETMIGYNDGRSTVVDAYGRRPWDKDFNNEINSQKEFNTLYRFKGEFAKLYGPYHRGRSFEFGSLSREKDSDKMHQYYLSLVKKKIYKHKR